MGLYAHRKFDLINEGTSSFSERRVKSENVGADVHRLVDVFQKNVNVQRVSVFACLSSVK